MKRYFTIGMAGHIDHGKTTLTKALTNIDTDRLKEEKERQISIELGFAPLYQDAEMQISVIDVPGHERFIRQMIAGVAGIDLVVLTVAADEGVMPQTKEHLNILRLLGIQTGIIAITKIDRVEDDLIELVQEEIVESLEGTVFADASVILIDSLSQKGVATLNDKIIDTLQGIMPRDVQEPFRLPIDQVFTVKGQGTVVRGTVYEGQVEEGEYLTVLPARVKVRARKLQVHNEYKNHAFAGQRTAINLTGVSKEELKRGDVLVASEHFNNTKTVDVVLSLSDALAITIKQRMTVKVHIGTAEVMGRIIFFDRKEVKGDVREEILCQLRLENEIVAKRGDRFIIRRPSPQETIGGGWIIEPRGEKYRFGFETVIELAQKKEGSISDRLINALGEARMLTVNELMQKTSISIDLIEQELKGEKFIQVSSKEYSLQKIKTRLIEDLSDALFEYHKENPMKKGPNKAEIIQQFQTIYPKKLIEYTVNEAVFQGLMKRDEQFIYKASFHPHVPASWSKRTETMLCNLKDAGTNVKHFENYYQEAGLPAALEDELKKFLVEQGSIIALDEQFYWNATTYKNAVTLLKQETKASFSVSEAKEILGLSRKYIIPFLESLDGRKITVREENTRKWLS
ncbi:selenocysteine-specific translation elongation factor [Cytobacillus purgationiresistens]|uniref:Selenocysteine-specific elongation factor n=1 Tax=Cytobacillus purgationiresistens TaxID=863449 RepID=A0ABU0AES4_9BACI|nr:selenocysteine-specific translation elongation factor [Cytobacillus purgationiresistens]MDQ0269754.1 selenocysteine-specific elongation factor [Cytobacillus purgationiresistens]